MTKFNFQLPVKNKAWNPVFCTELSELNSILSWLLSDVMEAGRVEPQNMPWVTESLPTPLLTRTESYSQSCYKTFICMHDIKVMLSLN